MKEDELEEIINGVFSDMDEADFKRNTRNPLVHIQEVLIYTSD